MWTTEKTEDTTLPANLQGWHNQTSQFVIFMADIDTFFPVEFQKNFDMALQQMDARLATAVTRADFTGKKKWFNLAAARSFSKIITRKGDTPDGEFDASKYWMTQSPWELATVFDEWDEHYLGSIVLPTSDTVSSHAMALNRTQDDVIISALDATRYIGEDGVTTDAFPSSQSIASTYAESGSASSGLTIAKLRRAKYLMDVAEVPPSERYLVYGAQQVNDLLRTTELTSADYNTVKALVDGQPGSFLGFKFIDSQRLPIGTVATIADVRSCFAFHKSAIKFSLQGVSTKMDILPERRHALQIRSIAMMGAVRTENAKVVRIYADETP